MSGALIGGIVGAVIGFFVGGGPAGAAYGFEIGAAIGGLAFPGTLPDQYGPRLSDLKVQVSTYGSSIPIVYGTVRLSGNVIWDAGIQEHSSTQDSGGGKGGGPSQSTTTYTYTCSAAVSLCEGPILGVRRIWADSTLIYDNSSSNQGPVSAFYISVDGKTANTVVYPGDESQLPDPTIEAHLGVGNSTAYRGQAYVVFTDFPLDKFGNRLPTFSFEVVQSGSVTNQLQYYVHPNTADGNIGLDWIYNPLVNEVWALCNEPSPPMGLNPVNIQRIDPNTGNVIGYIKPWQSLPNIGGGTGYFVDIIYDAETKAVYLDSDEGVASSYTCKIDAATGTLQAYISGSRYYVANINPYDGSVWYLDIDHFAGLYQLDQDTLAIKQHLTVLPIFAGPLCFTADGKLYMCDFNYISIWCYDGFSWSNVFGGPRTSVTFGTTWTYGGDQYISQDLAYDKNRDCLWLLAVTNTKTKQYIFQIDRFGGDLLSATLVGDTSRTDNLKYIFDAFNTWGGTVEEKFYDPVNDVFWVTKKSTNSFPTFPITYNSDGRLRCLRASDFSITVDQTAIVEQSFYTSPFSHAQSGTLYFTWRDSDPSVGTIVPARMLYGRVTPGVVTLSDVITDISTRTGQLISSDLDVSGQTSTLVNGYSITRQSTARSCIEQLQQAYFFDAVESDGKMKFVNRGGGVAVTIPSDDLAAFKATDNTIPDDLASVRADETSLPAILAINYQAKGSDYQTGTQYSKRLVGATGGTATYDMPIVLTDDQAKQVVDTAMFNAWAARDTFKWQTTAKYMKYEPTDLIEIGDHVIRVTKKDEDSGLVKWEGVADHPAVYSQSSVGAVTNFTPQNIQLLSKTDAELMDIPMLRDSDNDAGFYFTGNGYTTGWNGFSLFKSIDNGASYNAVGSLTNGAAIGHAGVALPNFTGGNIFDYVNTLTVGLIGNGTLSSTTELAVLNGANAALIGNEIIQFKTAVLNADGTYTLSGLLRGRRGTEWAMATHTTGESFVALTTTTMLRAAMATAEIGLARLYKGVSIGDSLANTSSMSFTNNAVSLKPYAPVQLTGSRDGSNNLTINWIRRTRIGGEWRDLVDVPLGEASELYDVEVWNAGYTTLKRTIAGVTSATAGYSAVQQIADFGSTQSTVYLRIYQISATVGRGYKLEGTA